MSRAKVIESPSPTIAELRRLVANTKVEMDAWILRYAISYAMLDKAERASPRRKKR